MSSSLQVRTTVRRPRTRLTALVLAGGFAMMLAGLVLRPHLAAVGQLTMAPIWFIGPILAAIQRRPLIKSARLVASPAGLSVDGVRIPRERLATALLRREGDKDFLLFRGPRWTNLDVEVASEDAGEELLRALGMDAKSTTVELSVFRSAPTRRLFPVAMVVAIALTGALVAATHSSPLLMFAAMGAAFVGVLATMVVAVHSRRVKLLVGADGIVVRPGLRNGVFYPHDAITSVRAEGGSVVLERGASPPLRFEITGQEPTKQTRAGFDAQARSIVHRIEKAREAFRQLADGAPQSALVLARGDRSAHEWLQQLKRVGEGATATFRTIQLTRDQLLQIVESTTAKAKERLAAAVALRGLLTEQEQPRLRVAVDRCVSPELRQRMVRVIEAPDDDALAAALEEADALQDAVR